MKTPDTAADLSTMLDLAQEPAAGRSVWLDPHFILNLALRFRWVLIAPFAAAMAAGIVLSVTLPRIYRSEATILVEPQSVPDKYVHSTVPVEIDARIASLGQQILSGSNLMALIERFNLFTEDGDRKLLMEEKVVKMRDRIQLQDVGGGRRGGKNASAFSISFENSDPRKAFQVVSALATFVIDQNLKMRESHAFGTSEFLAVELTKMRGRLEEVEKALEEFRRVHMGELPEQLQSNLTILERLQQQLGQAHQSLRDEKNRLLMVESQIKVAQQSTAPALVAALPAADGGPRTLEGLRQQLLDYQTRYTDNHPDVAALKKKIETLEKQLAEAGPAAAGAAPAQPAAPAVRRPGMEAELFTQQQTILRNIQAVEAEVGKIKAQMEFYQKRVENTPKREQELLLLKRDYDNIKATYSSVLNRKLEADIALNMERTQKGEQFRILDPPRIPEKPISPDLRRIFLACLAAGLGAGAGIIYLLEFFDRSVRRPEALQSRFSLPVLMVMPSIPHMQPQRSRVIGWLNDGLSAVAALACLALLAVLASTTLLHATGLSEVLKRLLR